MLPTPSVDHTVVEALRKHAPVIHDESHRLTPEFFPDFINNVAAVFRATNVISTNTISQLESLLISHLRKQAEEHDGTDASSGYRPSRPAAIRNLH